MATSDLNLLLEMGFDKDRAEMAVKKSGGLQGSLEWLEANQDKTLEELKAPAPALEDDASAEPPALKEGEVARSLVCNECGKKFRSTGQAEFHASKTEHTDFSESTEEIAPLTEEERQAKLAELKQKLSEKRATQSVQDVEDRKKNEAIRRKVTHDTADIKEEMKKKEQLKEAAAKKREKQAEIAAKERIREKIKADQEERRLKAQKQKAEREGQASSVDTTTTSPTVSSQSSQPKASYTETRLRLQTQSGNVLKTFPVDTTLFEVAAALESEDGIQVQTFVQNFPKKEFQGVDFGKTLKEAGLVPSAALIVK